MPMNTSDNNNPNGFTQPEIEAVYKAIYQRRDMRHFLSDPLDADLLHRLLGAAHAAPSVGFMQPWRFIQIKNRDIRQQLHDIAQQEKDKTAAVLGSKGADFSRLKVEGLLECGELIAVTLMDKRKRHVFGRRTLPQMDLASASCAIQNIWLAARAEGIGMGWVSIYDPESIRACLKLPADCEVIALLCLGQVEKFYDQPMLIDAGWAERGKLDDYLMVDSWDREKAARAQKQWQSLEENQKQHSPERADNTSLERVDINSPERAGIDTPEVPGKKLPRTLMVQGTTSDAGKSTLVAALCRILSNQNKKVVPFKPQNMALNSAVTADGGEIGRAQAVQAEAARLAPHTDMNPVLLKPSSDKQAQVIIHGKALLDLDAVAYHDYKSTAMAAVLESHTRLQAQYDFILVEGAGSPAEINLRDRDIANMGFAEAVDCPVIIIADIDKGGVFAHLVGTLDLLSESEQNRVIGFVINRFRGDIKLLESGLDWLEQKTGKPVLGVVPYLQGLHIEAEDALTENTQAERSDAIRIVVPALRRISNHTDFDALRLHPQVEFIFVGPGEALPSADLIVLPGSKNVRADMDFLRQQGWDKDIAKHLRYGGKLLGICGGYQMLGDSIDDPDGIEDKPGVTKGLGLLEFNTQLLAAKQLRQVAGTLMDGAIVEGYEIHCGVSTGPALDNPFARLQATDSHSHHSDGVRSGDDQISGTYIHGLFDHPAALASLLKWARLETVEAVDYRARREQDLQRLADSVAESIDIDQLFSLCDTFTESSLEEK